MCDVVNTEYLVKHFGKLENLSSVLEVGSYDVNGNYKKFIQDKGLSYFGIDIQPGSTVDLVADITDDAVVSKIGKQFDLIICTNALEHIYDPIKAIKNMTALLKPKGYLFIITPLIWPLHDWPYDVQRLNPNFYTLTAEKNNLKILDGTFYLTLKDSKKEFPVDGIPGIVGMYSGLKKLFLRFLARFVFPELQMALTYTYINLIYQKN